MSFSNRFINLIKQKVNKVLEKHEDPREALDYSAVKQTELDSKTKTRNSRGSCIKEKIGNAKS